MRNRLPDRLPPDAIERKVGYMADYVIDEVPVEGRKRPRRVPRYIGPWFAFEYPDEDMVRWKKIYFFGYVIMWVLLLVPLCLNCNVLDAWYVLLGEVIDVLALSFGVGIAWMLFRSGDRLKRRDADRLDSRIPITAGFAAGGFAFSAVGAVVYMVLEKVVSFTDIVVVALSALGCAVAVFLLVNNGKLDTYQVDGE